MWYVADDGPQNAPVRPGTRPCCHARRSPRYVHPDEREPLVTEVPLGIDQLQHQPVASSSSEKLRREELPAEPLHPGRALVGEVEEHRIDRASASTPVMSQATSKSPGSDFAVTKLPPTKPACILRGEVDAAPPRSYELPPATIDVPKRCSNSAHHEMDVKAIAEMAHNGREHLAAANACLVSSQALDCASSHVAAPARAPAAAPKR
jgi:hypothetical protein